MGQLDRNTNLDKDGIFLHVQRERGLWRAATPEQGDEEKVAERDEPIPANK